MNGVILAACITGGFIISTILLVLYCWIRSVWLDKSQEKVLFIWRSYVVYRWLHRENIPDDFLEDYPTFRKLEEIIDNINHWSFWYVLNDNTGKSILKSYYKSEHFMKKKSEVDTLFREVQKWLRD